MKKYIWILLCITILISCSTFTIVYETYIEGNDNKTLTFEDDKFKFVFLPVHNGLFFTINNLTDKTAYLIWNKMYFIEPDGNSYNAANIDLLIVEKEFSEKDENISIIPPNGKFSRFTTSTTNIDKFTINYSKFLEMTAIYSEGENIMSSAVISNEIKKFISIGPFWTINKQVQLPTLVMSEENEHKLLEEGNKLIEEMKNKNNMGIGFYISIEDNEYEYNFNFNFKKVLIYKTVFEDEDTNKILVYYSKEDSDWQWEVSKE